MTPKRIYVNTTTYKEAVALIDELNTDGLYADFTICSNALFHKLTAQSTIKYTSITYVDINEANNTNKP